MRITMYNKIELIIINSYYIIKKYKNLILSKWKYQRPIWKNET